VCNVPPLPTETDARRATVSADSDGMLDALAWVVVNRARSLRTSAGRFPAGVLREVEHLAPFLVSVLDDLQRYCRSDALESGLEPRLRAISALADDPAMDDPTAGALLFCPHWLEPADAHALRATALIGPFVFFAQRERTAFCSGVPVATASSYALSQHQES